MLSGLDIITIIGLSSCVLLLGYCIYIVKTNDEIDKEDLKEDDK